MSTLVERKPQRKSDGHPPILRQNQLAIKARHQTRRSGFIPPPKTTATQRAKKHRSPSRAVPLPRKEGSQKLHGRLPNPTATAHHSQWVDRTLTRRHLIPIRWIWPPNFPKIQPAGTKSTEDTPPCLLAQHLPLLPPSPLITCRLMVPKVMTLPYHPCRLGRSMARIVLVPEVLEGVMD